MRLNFADLHVGGAGCDITIHHAAAADRCAVSTK